LIGAHKSSIDLIGQGFLEGRNGISSSPRGQIIVLGLPCVDIATWWKLSGDVLLLGLHLREVFTQREAIFRNAIAQTQILRYRRVPAAR
jgi:hypothetical protein